MQHRLAVIIGFALALRTATALSQSSAPANTIDLPVKSVVLFSSGVGYFEHAGTVHGDGTAELRFKTAQINDILKSLLLQDRDGGKIDAMTYPSQDPVSKTLRSFQVDITANPTMASLLTQLRGARVTVQFGGERISGTVLGVETRRKAGADAAAVDVPTLNLLTDATIRSIELPAITSLVLDDRQLQDELHKALSALSQSRDQDKKPVTISFSGAGNRRVRVGYVVETPIWKTSYRLVLEEKRAYLQGWAIVENQTEADWRNVSLSLVSGRPISFIMDLYRPLYVQRPTVVPDLFAGLRPQTYADGLPVDRISNAMAMQPGNAVAPRDQVSTMQRGAREDASITTGARSAEFGGGRGGTGIDVTAATNSVQSIAAARELGALFQYAIPNVTLARQKSAMLPIVTDTVAIERLSIFNASVLPRNPLNGVRMRNTTGKHLMQGPVTVLDDSSYAGDARIDDVPPGQSRLMSYGVDLDLTVDTKGSGPAMEVATATIDRGTLVMQRKLLLSQEYLVDNKSAKDKTIVIEHPLRQGWKLVSTQSPLETTATLYRFQGTATAGRVTTLKVQEENVREERITMLATDVDQLTAYTRNAELPAAVRDAVVKAVAMKQAIVDLERDATARKTQIDEISAEQERLRENIKTVDAKSDYAKRLLQKLNEQESVIERLQRERDDLLARRDAQRTALEEYLNGLTLR